MTSKRTGGKAYRQHQSLKAFIRERDNYTCQLCGKEGWIVDHIVPWRVSRDSSIGNLRVLCQRCNVLTRRNIRRRYNPYQTLEAWYAYLERELAVYHNQP